MELDIIKDIGIPIFALVIGAGGLNWYKAIAERRSKERKAEAEADKAESDVTSANLKTITEGFTQLIEQYKGVIEGSNSRISRLETKVGQLEDTINAHKEEIAAERARVRKRDHIIIQATRCKVANAQDCPVICEQIRIADSKSEKIQQRELYNN